MIDDALIAGLETEWPAWQVWTVHRVVGGTLWCARRRDGTGDALNAGTPAGLSAQLRDAAETGSAGAGITFLASEFPGWDVRQERFCYTAMRRPTPTSVEVVTGHDLAQLAAKLRAETARGFLP